MLVCSCCGRPPARRRSTAREKRELLQRAYAGASEAEVFLESFYYEGGPQVGAGARVWVWVSGEHVCVCVCECVCVCVRARVRVYVSMCVF